jgi:hypothetical protein
MQVRELIKLESMQQNSHHTPNFPSVRLVFLSSSYNISLKNLPIFNAANAQRGRLHPTSLPYMFLMFFYVYNTWIVV